MSKPFGWEIDVLRANGTRETLHYRGSKSKARMSAILKHGTREIAAVRPVSEIEWRRAYGDPETRGC